jgi:signal transduction histidine kinase
MTELRSQPVPPRPFRPLLAPSRSESIRRQESGLILLNLTVLAGLAGLHVLFSGALGSPSRLFFAVVFGRFAMQVVELLGLQLLPERAAARLLPPYAHASIWLNVGFAFLIAWLAHFEDSHYVALMVIPVIAAAFRYRWQGIALVVAAAVTLTFLQVWLYFQSRGVVHPSEYFEATNVMLIYVVVAVIVAFLSRQVRSEQAVLRHNLDELERTRDRLVEEEKLAAVGRLASSIAHEIRNPVSLIVSSLEMAREGRGTLSADDLEEIVHGEAARLEKLTSDFLLSARQRPPERRPTALADSLAYVASLAGGRAAEEGVRLEVRCPEGLAADLDAFQLHQALLNLVLNAIDATPAGGVVAIAAAASGDDPGRGEGAGGVRLIVENQGDAIPEEVADRIFEPFFTTKDTGTGLGLTIARNVARAHGGDLELAANRPGLVRMALDLPGCRVGSAAEPVASASPAAP